MPVRTPLAIGLAGALIAAAWLRLESGPLPLADVLLVLGLAGLPAIAQALRRRPIIVGAVFVLALLVAASVAVDIPLSDARPRSDRDFFGPLFDAIHQGFLDFYDTTLPFDRLEFALMHSLILLAIFGFGASAAFLLAAGRPIAAGAVLLVAAGWPATLAPGAQPLAGGALVLAGILAILFLARSGPRLARGVPSAVAAGVVLIAIAVGASTTDAVAKRAFLGWQAWDLYDAPKEPVGVRYVWNSHYQGISFPDEETVVLRVRVAEPDRKLYWRATTLDEYTGLGWRESLDPGPARRAAEVDFSDDPLLPEAALDEESWVEQNVVVGALSDNHLIASAQVVKIETGTGAPVQEAESGVVLLPRSLRTGQRYTAWSYVPDIKPSELGETPGVYGPELDRYLEILPGLPFPAWGAERRGELVDEIFDERFGNFLLGSYVDVYRKAREIVGEAKSPYAAALALEAWLRSQGGFTYNEDPAQSLSAEPPLVAFLLRTKEGYCQHFAGAMAVMLRLLGVPARVAAGFSNGEYNEKRREWTVTDYDAHTWVEVYFPGYGWIPFDPTPGRGELTAAYSSVSEAFDRRDVADSLTSSDIAGSFVLSAIQQEALRAIRPELLGPGGFGVGGTAAAPDEGPSTALVAFLVVLAAVAALLVLKRGRRELRYARADSRALASACRRDLVGFLADQRLGLSPSATLEEVAEIVEREFVVDAGPFARSVSLARFGRPEDGERAARRARRELRTLRRQMRRELRLLDRIRGALSVRSLTA
jgi:hypothetical protein